MQNRNKRYIENEMLALGSAPVIGESQPEPLLNVNLEMDTAPIPTIPGNKSPLDLTAVNKGQIDAFAFVEVKVPIIPSNRVELEDPTSDSFIQVLQFSPNPEWLLISESMEKCVLSQVYAFSRPISPGEKTAPLIDDWSVINCRVEGGLTGSMAWGDIVSLCKETSLTLYSIQAAGMEGLDMTLIWQELSTF